jgi:hypothetical protein
MGASRESAGLDDGDDLGERQGEKSEQRGARSKLEGGEHQRCVVAFAELANGEEDDEGDHGSSEARAPRERKLGHGKREEGSRASKKPARARRSEQGRIWEELHGEEARTRDARRR